MTVGVLLLSLAAALSFATSSALKHASAHDAEHLAEHGSAELSRPARVSGLFGAAGRFVAATVAHPLWLAGIVADLVGLGLQVLALHFGALSVVQPLLVTGLIFALVLGRARRRIAPSQWLWAAVLCAALAGFLVLSGTATHTVADKADRMPALISALAGLVLAAGAVTAGLRRGSHSYRAASTGVAVGVVYAGTAALLKALTDRAAGGWHPVLFSWQLPAVIALGALGLMLNQLAFRLGPLTSSLPAISTVDPLLSIAIGVAVYDEHIRHGPLSGTGLMVLLLVLCVAIVRLSVYQAEPDAHAHIPAPAEMAG